MTGLESVLSQTKTLSASTVTDTASRIPPDVDIMVNVLLRDDSIHSTTYIQ